MHVLLSSMNSIAERDSILRLMRAIVSSVPCSSPVMEPLRDPVSIRELMDVAVESGMSRTTSCAAFGVLIVIHGHRDAVNLEAVKAINNEFERICRYIESSVTFDEAAIAAITLFRYIVVNVFNFGPEANVKQNVEVEQVPPLKLLDSQLLFEGLSECDLPAEDDAPGCDISLAELIKPSYMQEMSDVTGMMTLGSIGEDAEEASSSPSRFDGLETISEEDDDAAKRWGNIAKGMDTANVGGIDSLGTIGEEDESACPFGSYSMMVEDIPESDEDVKDNNADAGEVDETLEEEEEEEEEEAWNVEAGHEQEDSFEDTFLEIPPMKIMKSTGNILGCPETKKQVRMLIGGIPAFPSPPSRTRRSAENIFSDQGTVKSMRSLTMMEEDTFPADPPPMKAQKSTGNILAFRQRPQDAFPGITFSSKANSPARATLWNSQPRQNTMVRAGSQEKLGPHRKTERRMSMGGDKQKKYSRKYNPIPLPFSNQQQRPNFVAEQHVEEALKPAEPGEQLSLLDLALAGQKRVSYPVVNAGSACHLGQNVAVPRVSCNEFATDNMQLRSLTELSRQRCCSPPYGKGASRSGRTRLGRSRSARHDRSRMYIRKSASYTTLIFHQDGADDVVDDAPWLDFIETLRAEEAEKNGSRKSGTPVIDVDLIIGTSGFLVAQAFAHKRNSFLHNATHDLIVAMFKHTPFGPAIAIKSRLAVRIVTAFRVQDRTAVFWGQLTSITPILEKFKDAIPATIRCDWKLYIDTIYAEKTAIMQTVDRDVPPMKESQ